MNLNASSSGPAAKALKIWEEKLALLLEQEAIAAGAVQRFELSHQIEEAREKIRELQEPGLSPGVQTPGYEEKAVPEGTAPPSHPLQGLTVRDSQGFEPLASAAPPPLHNLPYSPLGALFTGRQDELNALATPGTAAISGLGGIGKTRLAVEYAWRAGNHYTAAWFVRADSRENLRRNLAALAGPELLNLPECETQVEEKAFAAMKRWLREHPGWLMILDNVDTPEAADAVLEVLPSLYIGHVLITSRLTSWPANVRKQSLDKLSHEEAVAFLLHRTKDEREPAVDDPERAADLAERVDGLPLALEQAAAYIIRHRMRLTDYLRSWEQERSKLLSWYDPRVMQYPASVAVTWKQTFDRLSPTPATLLRLTAFLAPDPIPVDIFEQGEDYVEQVDFRLCEEVGKEPDELTIQDALAELAEYSLITRQDGGMLVVHRMVQEALRSQIPEEHRRDWIEGTLRIVNDAAIEGPDDVRTWPVWDRLRPHVAEIVTRADEVGIVEPTSRLMNDLGRLLWARSLYSEAEPLVRRALEIDEAALGPQHTNVAISLSALAWLLQATNRLEEAVPLMRRALDIVEASSRKESSGVAALLRSLAELLMLTNRLEEAEPLLRRALSIAEASFSADQSLVTACLITLASLLQATNRLEEADPLIRRALASDTAFFGNKHPVVARDVARLALLLQATNRLGEAEPLMRRAVEIYEKSVGPGHPITRDARRNLESLLAKIAAAAPGGDDDLTTPEAL